MTISAGNAGPGEVRAHLIPALNSAAAAEERADNAPSLAGSASSMRPSASEKDGFMKSSRQRKLKEDRDMMAMFEMTDGESDVSDMQFIFPKPGT
eukprot:3247557-Pyramimonas_sp.AAC.1